MSTALELVYEYRHLIGKCRAGTGLSMEEIEAVEVIEGLFASGPTAFGAGTPRLAATLRGGRHKLSDRVDLLTADLDQITVEVEAFFEPGSAVELCIEDDELRLSYRFKCRALSVEEDLASARQKVVLELVGGPLLIRRGTAPSRPEARSMPPRPSSEPRVVAA